MSRQYAIINEKESKHDENHICLVAWLIELPYKDNDNTNFRVAEYSTHILIMGSSSPYLAYGNYHGINLLGAIQDFQTRD